MYLICLSLVTVKGAEYGDVYNFIVSSVGGGGTL